MLDATLEENEVSEADRSDFLRLFGDPKALSDVGAWLFEGAPLEHGPSMSEQSAS